MTTNERRAAWRQYAVAALAGACARPQDFETQDDDCRRASACDNADEMIAAEAARFAEDDTTDLHAALATARAHALEQQTRAENAEMALRMATRQSQHVASVPTVPVAELHTLLSVYEGASDGPADYVTEERLGALAAYQLIAGNLRALITAAEQRAAVAKPAEGGEP